MTGRRRFTSSVIQGAAPCYRWRRRRGVFGERATTFAALLDDGGAAAHRGAGSLRRAPQQQRRGVNPGPSSVPLLLDHLHSRRVAELLLRLVVGGARGRGVFLRKHACLPRPSTTCSVRGCLPKGRKGAVRRPAAVASASTAAERRRHSVGVEPCRRPPQERRRDGGFGGGSQ